MVVVLIFLGQIYIQMGIFSRGLQQSVFLYPKFKLHNGLKSWAADERWRVNLNVWYTFQILTRRRK
jgi:hypothetical protein